MAAVLQLEPRLRVRTRFPDRSRFPGRPGRRLRLIESDRQHRPRPARSHQRAVYRRRRVLAALVGLGLVLTVARAGAALGGSSLATPERLPHVQHVVVEPGDTLWSIAAARRRRVTTCARSSTRWCTSLGDEHRASPARSIVGADALTPTRWRRSDYRALVRCPYCRANDDKVVDSRSAEESASAFGAGASASPAGGGSPPTSGSKRCRCSSASGRSDRAVRRRASSRPGIERSASGRLDDAAVDQLVADVEEELRAMGRRGPERPGRHGRARAAAGPRPRRVPAVRVGLQGLRGPRRLRA